MYWLYHCWGLALQINYFIIYFKVSSHRYRLYNGLLNEGKCIVCCFSFWYSLFYNLLYCLCCFVFLLYGCLLWFILLFSIRCCSPVFSIYPIEFCCIIIWAGRQERRGSNSLTVLYTIYMYVISIYVKCIPYVYKNTYGCTLSG